MDLLDFYIPKKILGGVIKKFRWGQNRQEEGQKEKEGETSSNRE